MATTIAEPRRAAVPLVKQRCLYSGSATLNAVEIKRLSGNLQEVVACYTSGEVPDYQMSALLMASFIRGIDYQETLALAQAMAYSGRHYSVPGCVDKHSTGRRYSSYPSDPPRISSRMRP